MRKLYLLLLFSAISLSAISEELIIKEFSEATTDLSASTNLERDLNGNPCALIIVYVAADNVTFKGNVVKQYLSSYGEYWVYMSAGSKRFTVNAPGYVPIVDFTFSDYGINSLEGKVTYKMIIDAPSLGEKKSARTAQYLEFHISPIGVNACIQIEGEDELHYVDKDGLYSSYRVFGSYTYSISAPDYYPQKGAVLVNDPDNKKIVPVKLVPSFGYLKLNSPKEYDGATVSIDGKVQGVLPMDKIRLSKGKHDVIISKTRYATQRQDVFINDGEAITSFSVKMSARFITMTISSEDQDAELWLDNQKIGKGETKVDLGFGDHVISARKDKHKDAIVELKDVNAKYSTQVQVPSPKPIIGTVNIVSKPQGATIKIDGVQIGSTPILKDILIGSHKIEVEKSGYQKEQKQIELKEGENQKIEFELSDRFDVEFATNVDDAELSVDGKSYGKLPMSLKLSSGSHNVVIQKSGYHIVQTTINAESCNGRYYTQLQPAYVDVYMHTNAQNAVLYIDGQKKGTLPLTIKLASGKHTISAKANGYKNYTETYTTNEETTRHFIGMRRESRAKTNLENWYTDAGKFRVDWFGIGGLIGTTFGVEASAFDIRYGIFEIRPCVWSYEWYLSPATKLSHNKQYGGITLNENIFVRNASGSYYPYSKYKLERARIAYSPKVIFYIPVSGSLSLYLGGGPLLSWTNIAWKEESTAESTYEGTVYGKIPPSSTRYFDSIWFTAEMGLDWTLGYSNILLNVKYQDGLMLGVAWRIGTIFEY